MKTKSTFIQRYALLLFLILTPLISLAIPLFSSLPAQAVPLIIVCVPPLLAIILTALTEGGKGVGALLKKLVQGRVGIKWYAIAIALALGLRLAMSAAALLLGWIPSFQLNDWSPQEYIILGVFFLIGAVTEELGWRGYVLPRLMASRSALTAALLIGVIWGSIHLGLNLPGQMNAGAPWLPIIPNLIGLSVILTWLCLQTRGSLVIPILFHIGQSYFGFLNGGIASSQQTWLLSAGTILIALVLIVLFGPSLQSSPMTKVVAVNES